LMHKMFFAEMKVSRDTGVIALNSCNGMEELRKQRDKKELQRQHQGKGDPTNTSASELTIP
jgi:hypothetical protein